jgi:hypothetical protein
MTDESRQGEERERPSPEENEQKRREDKQRRSNELQESWRRNHPSEEEQGTGRPNKGGYR